MPTKVQIDELVKELPTTMRDAMEVTRRRINRTIMVEDVKAPDPLTETEVRGVRLGMLAIEMRRLIVRGDIVLPTGDKPHHALGLLDAALQDVGLLSFVKTCTEDVGKLREDVETTTRELIATIRRLRGRVV